MGEIRTPDLRIGLDARMHDWDTSRIAMQFADEFQAWKSRLSIMCAPWRISWRRTETHLIYSAVSGQSPNRSARELLEVALALNGHQPTSVFDNDQKDPTQ